MSKRRRHTEEESSLELLLDTMCNTFGGIMFIAICVFIIIFNLTETQSDTSRQSTMNMQQLQQEITSLQNLLTEFQKLAQAKNTQLQYQTAGPDNRKELLIMEQILKEQQLKISVLEQTMHTRKELLRKLEQLKSEAAEQLNQNKQKQQIQFLQLQQLQTELTALKNNPVRQNLMTFQVMKGSSKAPFFIIIHSDKIYPVGPWLEDQNYKIDKAVTSRELINDDGHFIECQIQPDSGINILTGEGDLSENFINFLQKLPPDRVPKFYLPPGSAETAFKMREILKSRRIFHGCTIAPDDHTPFVFQYTPETEYEY